MTHAESASTGLRLDGKRALITGATKGIGADIARTFASAGAKLILSGRDRAALSLAESALTEEFEAQIATAAIDLAERDAARGHLVTPGAAPAAATVKGARA